MATDLIKILVAIILQTCSALIYRLSKSKQKGAVKGICGIIYCFSLDRGFNSYLPLYFR